jgi:hypothetical protein
MEYSHQVVQDLQLAPQIAAKRYAGKKIANLRLLSASKLVFAGLKKSGGADGN